MAGFGKAGHISVTLRENSEQVSTLSCLANGLEPLNYHWQMYQSTNDSWTKPSVRAENITSPKLVFSKLTDEDEGICDLARDEPILLLFSPIFLSGNSFILSLLCSIFCSKLNILLKVYLHS